MLRVADLCWCPNLASCLDYAIGSAGVSLLAVVGTLPRTTVGKGIGPHEMNPAGTEIWPNKRHPSY